VKRWIRVAGNHGSARLKRKGRHAPISLAIAGALFILLLVVAPQLWITSVLRRYAAQRQEIPWTGGEFARHLLDGMKLQAVKVEETDHGDHYHPRNRCD